MEKSNREYLKHLTNVAWFLYGAHRDRVMYQGIHSEEALRSFCELVEIDEATLKLKFGGFI